MNLLQSRREIMKFLGLSPMAMPHAAGELRAMLDSRTVGLAAGAAKLLENDDESPKVSPLKKLLGRAMFSKLDRMKQYADDDRWVAVSMRLDGLDPDIGALKSVSRVNKVRMQFERDVGLKTLLRRVDEMMWP